MGVKITFDVNRMRASANLIKDHANKYETHYKTLMNQVDELSTTWKGSDNLAFSKQIKAFNDDFIKMRQVLLEYANYLQSCANAYQELVNDRVAKANQLSN